MFKHWQRWIGISLIAALMLLGCGTFRGGTAKQNAVQALVTTTRSAVLLMTAAGIAYDAGAFGEPGSARAEETWSRIAAESLRLNAALNDWTQAIKDNKDASTYNSMVAQALAVIAALLPGKGRAALVSPETDATTLPNNIAAFARPESFRPQYATGGAR